MIVGVLALQGNFAAHARQIEAVGGVPREVRSAAELSDLEALILPGGESTTLLRLLEGNGLDRAIREFGESGRPVFGTCAGAILMAREVIHPAQRSLGLIDLQIERNAYGRQVDSFIGTASCPAVGDHPVEIVFIRAPIIRQLGDRVQVLCRLDGHPILVQEGNILAATFHPELSQDPLIHEYFLEQVKKGEIRAGLETDPDGRRVTDPR